MARSIYEMNLHETLNVHVPQSGYMVKCMRVPMLTFFALFSLLSTAQAPVSPYYPAPLHFDQKWVTPIGYVEHTHVSNTIQSFLSEVMQMTSTDVKFEEFADYGVETLTIVDKITTEGHQKKLFFAFKVIEVDGNYITESLKITGDTERLISFFVKFWPTTLHLDDFKDNKIAHSYLLQDEATYYGDYIEVKNKTIKSKDEFLENFKISKAHVKQEKELKEAELHSKKAEKVTFKTVRVAVKKSKKGLDFEAVDPTIKPYVVDFLNEKDNGDYVLAIRTSHQSNAMVDVKISINKFEATKGKQLMKRFLGSE